MDVIMILTSVALFAAGCAIAYRAGYTSGATAMSVYYEVMQKMREDSEGEE